MLHNIYIVHHYTMFDFYADPGCSTTHAALPASKSTAETVATRYGLHAITWLVAAGGNTSVVVTLRIIFTREKVVSTLKFRDVSQLFTDVDGNALFIQM